METRKELTEKILKLTVLIQEQYPELSEYLDEVQQTLPALKHPEVDTHALQQYYQALNNMLRDYLFEHPELLNE